MRITIVVSLLAALLSILSGCKSVPAPPQTGFLSDYSNLEPAENQNMRWRSDDIARYNAWIIDPIEVREISDPPVLNEQQRADVINYFTDALTTMLTEEGVNLVTRPAPNTARLRIAITDVSKSKWWLSLHPASKVTGAGTGGAAMEAEIVDSLTGRQLAAVVQAGRGNQFQLDTFNAVNDIRDVIDRWVEAARERLREVRALLKE